MNGTLIGRSITKSQHLQVVNPRGGHPMNVLIIYDDGCQNCQVSYNLRSYSLGDREATFTMKTLGDSKELHGGVGRFQIQSMHNPNQSLILDCLYNDLSETFIRSQRVDVPRIWQERFGLNPVHYTP